MLILTRTSEQSIIFTLDESIDPQTPIGEIFEDFGIEFLVSEINSHTVKLGVIAPASIKILRAELLDADYRQIEIDSN